MGRKEYLVSVKNLKINWKTQRTYILLLRPLDFGLFFSAEKSVQDMGYADGKVYFLDAYSVVTPIVKDCSKGRAHGESVKANRLTRFGLTLHHVQCGYCAEIIGLPIQCHSIGRRYLILGTQDSTISAAKTYTELLHQNLDF